MSPLLQKTAACLVLTAFLGGCATHSPGYTNNEPVRTRLSDPPKATPGETFSGVFWILTGLGLGLLGGGTSGLHAPTPDKPQE